MTPNDFEGQGQITPGRLHTHKKNLQFRGRSPPKYMYLQTKFDDSRSVVSKVIERQTIGYRRTDGRMDRQTQTTRISLDQIGRGVKIIARKCLQLQTERLDAINGDTPYSRDTNRSTFAFIKTVIKWYMCSDIKSYNYNPNWGVFVFVFVPQNTLLVCLVYVLIFGSQE